MTPARPSPTWLAILACAALVSLPAAARASDHTLTFRVGSIQVHGDARVRISSEDNADILGYSRDRLDLGRRKVPRVAGIWHISPRNRIVYNYFAYDPQYRYVLQNDRVIEGYTIPAGSRARADARFKLGTLVYDGALVETPTLSFGLQAGLAWGAMRTRLQATVDDLHAQAEMQNSGFAPVVGLRLAVHTADRRWGFMLQGQYVNASWGSLDDWAGSLTRANALLEYRLTPHVGIHLGYDHFRLDISRDFGIATGGLELRFAGPFAGLTLAF